VTLNIAIEERSRSTEFKVQTKLEVNIYYIKRAATTENMNGCFYNGDRNFSVNFKILAYINPRLGTLKCEQIHYSTVGLISGSWLETAFQILVLFLSLTMKTGTALYSPTALQCTSQIA
jgi:hypothetical protein